jgi:hypothetical protein
MPQKRERDGVKRSRSLKLTAMACCPGSRSAFKDWFKQTTLPHSLGINPDAFDSSHFWEQMDGISKCELTEAEDCIIKKIFEVYDFKLSEICLDSTNFYTCRSAAI